MNNTEGKKATAVIVTFESVDIVGQALDALLPAYQAGLIDCVVVDNASMDNTASFIRDKYPWASVIASEKNIGYGCGCNLGLTKVSTPYVIFMNPDVEIHLNALSNLLDFAQSHPNAGLIGPSIRRKSGDYQQIINLPTPWTILRQAAGFPLPNRPILPGEPSFRVKWLCGAFMLGPTELIHKLGGFDPHFFLYFEETDLCVRIANAGHSLWAVPDAEASHASNSSARKVEPKLKAGGCLGNHFYPSRFYYLTKHYGVVSAFLTESFELFILGIKDLSHLMLRKGGSSKLKKRLIDPIFTLPKREPQILK